MIKVSDFYDAAAASGLIESAMVTATGEQFWVEFRNPDLDILGGLGAGVDYTIQYPADIDVMISEGVELQIGGTLYRVRHVRAIGDGSERRAALMAV